MPNSTSAAASDPARATALIDELLRSAYASTYLAVARDLAPPGWVDQLDAAADQVHAGCRRLADTSEHGTYRAEPYGRYPEWVTLGIMGALAEWVAGAASTCMHAPTAARPQPVHAAAWRPELVVCGRCQHLLDLPRGSDADRRCDGCGRLCEGVDRGDPIWPSVIVAGPMTYSLGTCRECRWESASTPAETGAPAR